MAIDLRNRPAAPGAQPGFQSPPGQQPGASPFTGASGHKPMNHYDQPFPANGQWDCDVTSYDVVWSQKKAKWILFVGLRVVETIVQPPGVTHPVQSGKWTRDLRETLRNKAQLWGEVNLFLVSIFHEPAIVDFSEQVLEEIRLDPKGIIGAPIVVRSFESIDENKIDPKTMKPAVFTNLTFSQSRRGPYEGLAQYITA